MRPDADVLPWVAPLLARLLPVERIYGARPVTEAALAWLGTQYRRRDDAAFARAFANARAATGQPEDAFLHRVFRVGQAELLGGVRFYGGDTARPFVDVLAWTEEPEWPAVAGAVAAEWSAFAPEAWRVLLADPPPGAPARLDQGVHLARVGDMPAPAAADVGLDPAVDPGEAAAFVADGYAAAIAAQPDLAGEIVAADDDTLAGCQRDGTLNWIVAGGVRAGLIATAPGEIEMLTGEVVVEEVVAADFRGRGLAATAQGLLAQTLGADDPGRVLLGTIQANNEASRRAAETAGRKALLSYWFVDLPG